MFLRSKTGNVDWSVTLIFGSVLWVSCKSFWMFYRITGDDMVFRGANKQTAFTVSTVPSATLKVIVSIPGISKENYLCNGFDSRFDYCHNIYWHHNSKSDSGFGWDLCIWLFSPHLILRKISSALMFWFLRARFSTRFFKSRSLHLVLTEL